MKIPMCRMMCYDKIHSKQMGTEGDCRPEAVDRRQMRGNLVARNHNLLRVQVLPFIHIRTSDRRTLGIAR